MSDLKDLQAKVNETFDGAFGETPMRERITDITREAGEVKRAGTLKNLKLELGQLICSCLQGCNEFGWSAEEMVEATLAEINRRQAQYKSLGRKVKVALLGGAFNPVTTGHIKLAKYVLDEAKEFDEVWLMPCFGHLYGKEMVSPDQRMKMVSLACECDKRLKPFSYEIDNQLAGETYHCIKRLLSESFAKDRYNFSYIIGQDNANSFDKWVNFEHLADAIRFVVVPRKGVTPREDVTWYRNDFHICMPQSDDMIEISSTEVRKMLSVGNQFVGQYLDPKVLDYIKENRLYGTSK